MCIEDSRWKKTRGEQGVVCFSWTLFMLNGSILIAQLYFLARYLERPDLEMVNTYLANAGISLDRALTVGSTNCSYLFPIEKFTEGLYHPSIITETNSSFEAMCKELPDFYNISTAGYRTIGQDVSRKFVLPNMTPRSNMSDLYLFHTILSGFYYFFAPLIFFILTKYGYEEWGCGSADKHLKRSACNIKLSVLYALGAGAIGLLSRSIAIPPLTMDTAIKVTACAMACAVQFNQTQLTHERADREDKYLWSSYRMLAFVALSASLLITSCFCLKRCVNPRPRKRRMKDVVKHHITATVVRQAMTEGKPKVQRPPQPEQKRAVEPTRTRGESKASRFTFSDRHIRLSSARPHPALTAI